MSCSVNWNLLCLFMMNIKSDMNSWKQSFKYGKSLTRTEWQMLNGMPVRGRQMTQRGATAAISATDRERHTEMGQKIRSCLAINVQKIFGNKYSFKWSLNTIRQPTSSAARRATWPELKMDLLGKFSFEYAMGQLFWQCQMYEWGMRYKKPEKLIRIFTLFLFSFVLWMQTKFWF